MISRGDVARLASQEAAFRARVAGFSCASATEARRLVQFAFHCVVDTPLDNGTPLSLLQAHPAIRQGVELVGCWLAGEAVTRGRLEDAWAAGRREADTLARDMVGATAAQWAAIAVIEAAREAFAADRGSFARVLQAVGFAALYARAAGIRPAPAALHYQMALADRLLSVPHAAS